MNYRFPNDKRQIWIDTVAEYNNSCRTIKDKQYHYQYNHRHRICERHFSSDSIIVNGQKKYLKPNAVPTIFKSTSSTAEIDEILKIIAKMRIQHQQLLLKLNAATANKTRQLRTIINNVRREILGIADKIKHLCKNEYGK